MLLDPLSRTVRPIKGVGLKGLPEVFDLLEGPVRRSMSCKIGAHHPTFDAAFPGHIPHELMSFSGVIPQFFHVSENGQRLVVLACRKGFEGRPRPNWGWHCNSLQ